MGYLATHMSRFFHPAAIDEMLSVFLPMLNGTNLDVSDIAFPSKE
jgi:proteasome activator subunit 4